MNATKVKAWFAGVDMADELEGFAKLAGLPLDEILSDARQPRKVAARRRLYEAVMSAAPGNTLVIDAELVVAERVRMEWGDGEAKEWPN